MGQGPEELGLERLELAGGPRTAGPACASLRSHIEMKYYNI
jgi:hypothetical protein